MTLNSWSYLPAEFIWLFHRCFFFYTTLTNNCYYLLNYLSSTTLCSLYLLTEPLTAQRKEPTGCLFLHLKSFTVCLCLTCLTDLQKEGGRIGVCLDLKCIFWCCCSDLACELIVLIFAWCISPGAIVNLSYRININAAHYTAQWSLVIIHQSMAKELPLPFERPQLIVRTSLSSGEGFGEREHEGWERGNTSWCMWLINAVT